MTDINQTGMTVKGHQINAGRDVSVGHFGDTYHIAEAQLNLSDELTAVLLATLSREKQEDYSQPDLALKIAYEPETVLIPAGQFLMGSGVDSGIPIHETPQFEMELPAFRIGKYPVTNAEYAHFLKETEQIASDELGWAGNNEPKEEQKRLPVRGVTWYDAIAYCIWLYDQTGRPYTLPSEAQWEKAARGTEGHLFPWGNEWEDGRFCNTDFSQVTPKSQFPEGQSFFEVWDMVGNVREWTTTIWGRNRKYNLDDTSKYPWTDTWVPNSGRDDLRKSRQFRRVTRGGASLVPGTPLRAARRESELPYHCGVANGRIGFRVVLNWEDGK